MGICASALLIFTLTSWRAVSQTSATIDEPLRFMAGYYSWFERDFRLDRENPPFCNYWSMLPHQASSLQSNPKVEGMERTFQGYQIATMLLFQTPANDGETLLRQSRAMMLVLGLILGLVLTCWSWQWGGPVAGAMACVLYCFDPAFLGHSPLLKNDVAIALMIVSLAWAVWSFGRRVTWWNWWLLMALTGLTLLTKFSGLVAGLMLGGIFILRILLGTPWLVLGREIRSRSGLCGVVVVSGVGSLVMSWGMIWAGYGFRYAPTPKEGQELDRAGTVRLLQRNIFFIEHGTFPSDSHLAELPTPLFARAVQFLDDHRILPQAWLDGLLYTRASTLVRQGYLLGEFSDTGWWYYYPLTMLFKMPVATLATMVLAIVGAVLVRNRLFPGEAERWSLVCVLVPIACYGFFVLTSHLNLGVRFLLPLLPFGYLLIGKVTSIVGMESPRRWGALLTVLAGGLAVESLAAYPHYISYFNIAARPYRLTLLSDSNFDWGQDLTYVARWQKANPDTPLFLAYWGPTDPAFYGIRATILPGGNGKMDGPPDMSRAGVIMVSATLLQGVNQPEAIREYYAPIRARNPDRLIGDSIYLFNWTPPKGP